MAKSYQFSLIGLVLLVPVASCGYNAWQQYQSFVTMSQERGCIANRNTIDKCVGVWESQYEALKPSDQPLWLEVDTEGKIVRVSAALEKQMASMKVADSVRLRPGNMQLFYYCQDPNVWRCFKRVNSGATPSPPEVHYRWAWYSSPQAELDNRARGTICLIHSGPRKE